MTLTARLARSLGYVQKADLDAEKAAHQKTAAEAKMENSNMRSLLERSRVKADKLRTAARDLFTKAVDLGLDPECLDGGSACGPHGDIITTGCTKACSRLMPKCAYNIGRRGLQLTQFRVF